MVTFVPVKIDLFNIQLKIGVIKTLLFLYIQLIYNIILQIIIYILTQLSELCGNFSLKSHLLLIIILIYDSYDV